MSNTALKTAIINSGMKSFEVAIKAGMHPSTLSHIANQHYSPKSGHIVNLARVLECGVEELFPNVVANMTASKKLV